MSTAAFLLRYIIALLSLVFLPLTFACDGGTTTIYFVNGVNTPREVARVQLTDFEKVVRAYIKAKREETLDDSCLYFESAYNPDEFGNENLFGILTDFITAARQLGFFDAATIADYIANSSLAPPAFRSLAEDYLSLHLAAEYILDDTLSKHIADYKFQVTDVGRGQLILVAHSQGNMYANLAYDHIMATNPEIAARMRVVSLATPDNHVSGYGLAGTEPYTKLREDPINFIPGGMPWNLSNGGWVLGCPIEGDWACHRFIDSYLQGPASRAKILYDVAGRVIPRDQDLLVEILQCAEEEAKKSWHTWTDAKDVDGLSCEHSNINSLAGLETLKNLTYLIINDNHIIDLTALGLLRDANTLEVLRLNSNGISDISALAGLTKLEQLNLSDNKIGDIGALRDLSGLQELMLTNNELKDISVLYGLKNLRVLALSGNEGVRCADLDALYNELPGTAIFRSWPPDCVPTSAGTPIDSIQFADPNLRRCVLDTATRHGWTTVEEMGILGNCDNYGIVSLEGIGQLSALTGLILQSNEITDIKPIASLKGLQQVGLAHNQITSVDALADLPNLVSVDLLGNHIDRVDPLRGHTGITSLLLTHNQISDISPLATLTGLELLGLDENQIVNVAPLFGLTKLVILSLTWNRGISCADLETLEAALPATQISRGECGQCGSVVGGACSLSLNAGSAGLCSVGTVAGFGATANGWSWSCEGPGGGPIARCSECGQRINGQCGSVFTDGVCSTWLSSSSPGLCSAGTVENFTLASSGNAWGWRCDGLNGGGNAVCLEDRCVQPEPVNGQCGSVAGGACSTSLTSGSSGLCSAGTVENFTIASSGNAWGWRCGGLNGGSDAVCLEDRCIVPQPIDGQCGWRDTDNACSSSLSPSSSGLCDVGSLSNFTDVVAGQWYWKCLGQDGGENAICHEDSCGLIPQ